MDVPAALRRWVIDRLEYIESTTGIALATSLANMLRSAENTSPRSQSMNGNPRNGEGIYDKNKAEVGDSKGWKQYLHSWTVFSRRFNQQSGKIDCRQDGDVYLNRQEHYCCNSTSGDDFLRVNPPFEDSGA